MTQLSASTEDTVAQTASLHFVPAPDALGMTVWDAQQHIVVMPQTTMTEAGHIMYLIDALKPLVAETTRELAECGAENPVRACQLNTSCNPAATRSASARSVFSLGGSTSSRPQ